ncbi:hypothetical protein [Burkholderia metallica]|uniref:hypothetical protein n=1 Tax=Burkholderia metallica TaxID=488729 RepID=UPI0015758B8B|nr:hypothetical protein [Burkholderia metallica]
MRDRGGGEAALRFFISFNADFENRLMQVGKRETARPFAERAASRARGEPVDEVRVTELFDPPA